MAHPRRIHEHGLSRRGWGQGAEHAPPRRARPAYLPRHAAAGCDPFGLVTYAYGLMPEQYRLLPRTPRANRSAVLRWLQATYGVRFDRQRLSQRRIGVRAHLVNSTRVGPYTEPLPRPCNGGGEADCYAYCNAATGWHATLR